MEINNFSAVSRQKQQQQVLARNRRSAGLLVLRDLQKFGFPDSKCELFIFLQLVALIDMEIRLFTPPFLSRNTKEDKPIPRGLQLKKEKK